MFNDEDFIRKCKKHEESSIDKKKEFILKYAPFSLLTAGWGKFQDKRQKKKDKNRMLSSSTEDFVWKKISIEKDESPIEITHWIYKKSTYLFLLVIVRAGMCFILF